MIQEIVVNDVGGGEEEEKSAQAAKKTLIPVPANLRRLLKVLSFVKLDESEKKRAAFDDDDDDDEENTNKPTLTRTVDA